MNMNTFYALDNWTQLTAYLNVDVNATSGSLPGPCWSSAQLSVFSERVQ